MKDETVGASSFLAPVLNFSDCAIYPAYSRPFADFAGFDGYSLNADCPAGLMVKLNHHTMDHNVMFNNMETSGQSRRKVVHHWPDLKGIARIRGKVS